MPVALGSLHPLSLLTSRMTLFLIGIWMNQAHPIKYSMSLATPTLMEISMAIRKEEQEKEVGHFTSMEKMTTLSFLTAMNWQLKNIRYLCGITPRETVRNSLRS